LNAFSDFTSFNHSNSWYDIKQVYEIKYIYGNKIIGKLGLNFFIIYKLNRIYLNINKYYS